MADNIKLKPGLYVTATPIGNLGDVTARAVHVLMAADRIACEDTRVTSKLLRHLGVNTPTFPCHEHNEQRVLKDIMAGVRNGEAIALVSDAGTPTISDPGYRLVSAMQDEKLPVFAIPGPAAPMAALMVAGLPTDNVCFHGFLPPKSKARQSALRAVASQPATQVFFESPKRLNACLEDMVATFGGGRKIAVCREITKLYEEVIRGSIDEVCAEVAGRDGIKGEVVIVLGPPEEGGETLADDALDRAIRYALETLSVKEAAVALSFALKLPRKTIYQRALELRGAR